MTTKKFFIASLIKNGILGGSIVADSEAITYRTGKLMIPQNHHLVMKYEDISEVTYHRKPFEERKNGHSLKKNVRF
jgi:hypothetical protein